MSGCLLVLYGLMAIYSKSLSIPADNYFKKQVMWLIIGLVPLFMFWRTDLPVWRKLCGVLYVVNLVLLALVLVKGSTQGGAQRWIQFGPLQFQPSEMAKMVTVLTVSNFYAQRMNEVDRLGTLIRSFLYVLPSMALVFLQPHLGATMVIFLTWLGISILAGVPWRFLVLIAVSLAVLGGSAYTVPGVLKDYQRARIKAMFVRDAKGKDYQTDQAAMAFGVGGVTGSGYLNGDQKSSNRIPEQHNDFIFTVIGEEGGLIACAMVMATFLVLFSRIWLAMVRSDDIYGRMSAMGVLCVLGAHTVANLGMNVQLLPVVGLWLPFLSYGGTALWLCLACLGLALNVSADPQRAQFSQSRSSRL